MKSTGIVRKIDELGRIVLPIEMRNRLEIGPGVGVEIFFENSSIVLRKYAPSCIFCSEPHKVNSDPNDVIFVIIPIKDRAAI